MVKSCLNCKRDMIGEEDFRSRSKGLPLRPGVLWVSILVLLVDEDGHDPELVIRLKDNLFCHQEPCRVIFIRIRVINGCAEVAGRAGSVLDGKRVITTMPLQEFMFQPEAVSV